jgi:hypothetical protein
MVPEDFVDSTIANLKVIGMVTQNGRLCVRKGQLCLERSDHAQGMRRWVHGDSRDVTLAHVRNTISNAGRILLGGRGPPPSPSPSPTPSSGDQSAGEHARRWTEQRISAELSRCEIGLQNLKATYMDDSVMVANLGVIIERITSSCGFHHLLMNDGSAACWQQQQQQQEEEAEPQQRQQQQQTEPPEPPEPQEPQEPQAPQEPQEPQELQEPKAPQAPQAPQHSDTKKPSNPQSHENLRTLKHNR